MIVPPLSELLGHEVDRHRAEVVAISRFHAFMTGFEENLGGIGDKVYKLKGISIANNVASFEAEDGSTYFFDGNKNPSHISGLGHDSDAS